MSYIGNITYLIDVVMNRIEIVTIDQLASNCENMFGNRLTVIVVLGDIILNIDDIRLALLLPCCIAAGCSPFIT